MRVDYLHTPPGRAAEPRFALCRFGSPETGSAPSELVGLATERGPLGGASLYLLRRYYLDTPDGVAGEPSSAPAASSLPDWPRPLAVGLDRALNALPLAGLYGLLAAAFALLHGLVGRINLAIGEVAAIGAAVAGLGFAAAIAAWPDAPGLAAGVAVGAGTGAAAAHGLLAGTAAFRCVSPRRTQASLIASLGSALALAEYLRLAAGPTPRWIPPLWSEAVPLARAGSFVAAVSPATLAVGMAGLAASAALVGLMGRTAFGRNWRAAAQDGLAAALFGVDRGRLLLATLALSGAASGLAGVLVALGYGALGFSGGLPLALKALAGAILGGVGSIGGAVLGGLAIGAVEALWSSVMPIDTRDVALLCCLVAAVVAWPDGIGRTREVS